MAGWSLAKISADDYRALVLRLESDLPTKVSGEVVNLLNGMLPAQIQTEFGAMRRILDGHQCNQKTVLASVTPNLSSLDLDGFHNAVVSQEEAQMSAHIGIEEVAVANIAAIQSLRTMAKTPFISNPTVKDACGFSSPDMKSPWHELRFHLLKW